MAEWLEQASQWYKEYCHNLEVIGSNLSWVELGVHSTCPKSYLNQKSIVKLAQASVNKHE